MKIYRTLLLVFLILTIGNSSSFLISRCYYINGPANLRRYIQGDILDTLPDYSIIKILSIKKDWYKVRTINSSATKFGWTHKVNIRESGLPLDILISQGLVILPYETFAGPPSLSQDNLFDHTKDTIIVLGMNCVLNNSLDTAYPLYALNVNVYCLDGSYYEDRIKSIIVDLSPSGGVYITVKLRKDLTDKNCIAVNGTIQESNNTNKKCSSIETDLNKLNGTEAHPFAKYIVNSVFGDYAGDGVMEALESQYINGAPSYQCWKVIQNDSKCISHYLGTIQEIGLP